MAEWPMPMKDPPQLRACAFCDRCRASARVAYMGKDGAPVEICSVAEGLLGVYEWWPQHLKDVLELGQLFPEWVRPHGSKGVITAAGGLTEFIAQKQHARGAIPALLGLPPLSYSKEELAAMGLRGHSIHVTPPEWGGTIGKYPSFEGVELPADLAPVRRRLIIVRRRLIHITRTPLRTSTSSSRSSERSSGLRGSRLLVQTQHCAHHNRSAAAEKAGGA